MAIVVPVIPGGRRNILVCDSETHVTKLLQTVLNRQGHSVLTTNSGAQAFSILTESGIDLIVLGDLEDISSIEFQNYLNTTPKTSNIPCLRLQI